MCWGAVFQFKREYERLDAGDYGGHNPSWLPHHYLGPEILTIPLWMTVAIPCGLALLSWVPGRFSLRSLLIATMLIAVVLGGDCVRGEKAAPANARPGLSSRGAIPLHCQASRI